MCNGTIMDKLISFSFPLMLTSILQLMFNAVDIIVVGRFSGSQSLAAVGSTTALINIFTNLFIGISLGANVLAARYYAAGRDKEMSEAVHTAIFLALISGLIMAVVGIGASRFALTLMGTPDDVIDLSVLYMRIYFMGMPFFMLYNYGAAILRAVGDTKRPLFYLIAAGLANVILDLLLVIVIPLNVAGGGGRNSGISDGVLYSGASMSVPDRGKLSAPLLQTDHQIGAFKNDLSGGSSGGHPEYGYQLFQCAAAVLGQFFWIDGYGGLYGSQ